MLTAIIIYFLHNFLMMHRSAQKNDVDPRALSIIMRSRNDMKSDSKFFVILIRITSHVDGSSLFITNRAQNVCGVWV